MIHEFTFAKEATNFKKGESFWPDSTRRLQLSFIQDQGHMKYEP